jgi:hypothetical protein
VVSQVVTTAKHALRDHAPVLTARYHRFRQVTGEFGRLILGCTLGATGYLVSRATSSPAPAASIMLAAPSQRRRAARSPISAMTSLSERAFCEWCTRFAYPSGTIVELGPWLGSLTRALLDGIRDDATPILHTYDRFEWEPYMAEWTTDPEARALQPGVSFRSLFERSLGPKARRLNIHTGDLAGARWTGPPIDVLIIDAMKGWDLARGIVSGFFASLRPGSLILHQDFADPWLPWIHLVGYRQRAHLERFADLPWRGGMVFRVLQPFGSVDARLTDPSSYSDTEVDKAFEYSRSISRREKWPGLAYSKAMFYALRGAPADLARAQAMFDDLARAGVSHGQRTRLEECITTGGVTYTSSEAGLSIPAGARD